MRPSPSRPKGSRNNQTRAARLGAEIFGRRGETMDVVRRPDAAISHLECATLVYTRTPYDPDVDVPGGHPR